MCGLIHIKQFDNKCPSEMLMEKYEFQRLRGQRGYGFVALRGGKIVAYERSEAWEDIWEKLYPIKCDEVLFHHRFPTSTENIAESNHPIKVSHRDLRHDYYLIHNGVIWETEKERPRHEKMGYKYQTELKEQVATSDRIIPLGSKFNDSETLAIDLARDLDNYEKGLKGIDLEGSIAFIMLQTTKHGKATKLFWGCDSVMPLVYEWHKEHYLCLSSESETSKNEISPNTLYTFDYSDNSISSEPYQIGRKRVIGFNSHKEPNEEVTVLQSENFVDVLDVDLQQDYFELIKEYEDLQSKYKENQANGKDDPELEGRLDNVEAALADMEDFFDRREELAINKQ